MQAGASGTGSMAIQVAKVLGAKVIAGRIRAALDRVLPLADARVVHEQVADGRIVGKVVLRP